MLFSSHCLLHRLRCALEYCRRHWRLAVAVLLLILLVMLFILSFALPHQNRYRAEKKVISLPTLPIAAALPQHDYWHDEIVQPGDTLASVLERFGIARTEIDDILKQPLINKEVQQLQVNQVFSIRLNEAGKLTDIQFFNDNDNGEKNLIALTKTNGAWKANIGHINTEILPVFKAVVIKTSARGALAQAGIPVQIREALREIFSDRVNVDDLVNGDTIRIIYQNLYYRGQDIATGDILAAEISHQDRLYQAYYYGDDENGQYYDASGQPLRKGFSRIPVNGARISSPFGTRFHPILQTILMHSGIDYAVPTGTPIYAPADGEVESVGVKGGYGNAVMLRHNSSMETLYGHMSAFADIFPGQRIHAGDVIGYVGMTGRATGPHLHYEVRINGQPVNPASAVLPTRALSASEKPQFKQQQLGWNQQLGSVRDLKVTIAHLD